MTLPISSVAEGEASSQGPAGLSSLEWWTAVLTIVEGGTLTSDPTYYSDGEAQPGEWANVIQKAFERTDPNSSERTQLVQLWRDAGFITTAEADSDYWQKTAIEDLGEDLENLQNAAEDRLPGLAGVDDVTVGGGLTGGLGGNTVPEGIRPGGDLIKIQYSDKEDVWGLRYVTNGIEHIYTFSSEEVMMKAMGKSAASDLGVEILPEATVNDTDTWIMGDATAHVGQDQAYQGYWQDLMAEASLESGVRNPGWAGKYAADKEINNLIAASVVGDWSKERLQAEIRNTDFYLNQLYPGIEHLLKEGVTDPENAYHKYLNDVDESLEATGYVRDADGSYRSAVEKMLTKGIRADKWNRFSGVYVRATESPEFFDVLNQWTQSELGSELSFDEWFDVLDGNAGAELATVVESATLQYQAEQHGITTLTPEQISNIAASTNLSEAAAAAAFNATEEQLLALGDAGLARYGLTVEGLVNAVGFGLATGDDSVGEIRRLANKTIRELGLADDRRAQFFQSFDESGKPFRPGLTAGAPERG